jgi:hypothetical protein
MTSRPGVKTEPKGVHSTITLADHTFEPDGLFRNSPKDLQDVLNEHRRQPWAAGPDVVEVPAPSLWVTLDRLARAEQSTSDKIDRFRETRSCEVWSSSDARRDLHKAIVRAQRSALAHCEASADAAGMDWTVEGLENITADYVIDHLVAAGWLPPKPSGPYDEVENDG